jgi:hypothetical protein
MSNPDSPALGRGEFVDFDQRRRPDRAKITCAMRMPRSMVKAIGPRLMSGTRISPR